MDDDDVDELIASLERSNRRFAVVVAVVIVLFAAAFALVFRRLATVPRPATPPAKVAKPPDAAPK